MRTRPWLATALLLCAAAPASAITLVSSTVHETSAPSGAVLTLRAPENLLLTQDVTLIMVTTGEVQALDPADTRAGGNEHFGRVEFRWDRIQLVGEDATAAEPFASTDAGAGAVAASIPIPEPASFALLAGGLLAFALSAGGRRSR